MPLKIGSYIRVSTEEQAQVIEGSLDSQKFRINGYVDIRNSQELSWGKLIETYIDDGFSAKDTRRPAGVAIRDYYQRYVFHADSNFDGLATKHHEEKSLHPPAITLEKAALIR